MDSSEKANLAGLKVVSFESRRAKEIAELVRRYGGEPITAPAMREISLSENHAALEILPQLEAGQFVRRRHGLAAQGDIAEKSRIHR